MSKFSDEVEELCKQRNLLVDESSSSLHTPMCLPVCREYVIKLKGDATRSAIGLYHLSESATVYFFNYSLRRYTKNIDELKFMLDVFMQSCKMYSRGLDEMWRMWHEGCSSEEQQNFGARDKNECREF